MLNLNGCFFDVGHFERPPYDHNTIKSVYHVREYDVRKLMQVKEPIDVFLSHDWPVRITDYGDWRELVRRKHYFKQEVRFVIVIVFKLLKLEGFL